MKSQTLTFYPTDGNFQENLYQLRQATIKKAPFAPRCLTIIIEGKATTASTAHIKPDGWFAYSDSQGERRLELHRIDAVQASF